MTDKVYNVLVLCTGNSARSILGEALFTHLGAGKFRGFSAGSRPSGIVNPLAVETLVRHGITVSAPRSKSWDEFALPDAPTFDFIFTVCANAADEPCPVWPGHPATAHWAIADPAHVEPLAARRIAFEQAFQQLRHRIAAFVALPLQTMTQQQIVSVARQIHDQAQP